MRYGFKTPLLFFACLIFFGCSRTPLSSKKDKLYTVAFYNTEKFFDTADNPDTPDEAYTPNGELNWTEEKYKQKLKNIATVVAGIAGADGPAIVGLSEIENRQVLEELIDTPPLRKYGYNIIHRDMDGPQGLDVALIYRPKLFKPSATESISVSLEDGYKTRDILQVKGELRGELVTVYVNHWPLQTRTRRGRTNGSRQRTAATTLRREIEKQQAADPNAKIIVMGDFDAEPKSEVMQKSLLATGRPNPAYSKELFNTHFISYVNGLGSYLYRGDFQMLDQILISKSLLNGQGGLQYVRGSAGIHNPVSIKYTFGKYRESPTPTFQNNIYLGGYSDHFPVYIQLRKEKKR